MATIRSLIEGTRQYKNFRESLIRKNAVIEALLDSVFKRDALVAFVKGVPGTLDGDLYCIFKTRASKEEKEKALERLANKGLKKPLPPQVREIYGHRINEIVSMRAAWHERSFKQEIDNCIQAAIFYANKELGECRVPFTYAAIKPFTRLMQRVLMKDFFGPKYWKAKKHRSLDLILQDMEKLGRAEEEHENQWRTPLKYLQVSTGKKMRNALHKELKALPDKFLDVEIKHDIDQFICSKKNLSDKEKAIIMAMMQGYNLKDIAKATNVNYNTVRSLRSRIKIKLNNMRKKPKP